jgi:hypothetical protein
VRRLMWAIILVIAANEVSEMPGDIVVYGCTASGIAAAVQARRMGKSVMVIEPTGRIGGLTTGGLGQTDIGNKSVIGGLAREFYRGIRRHDDSPSAWKWQRRDEYRSGEVGTIGGARGSRTHGGRWIPSRCQHGEGRMLSPLRSPDAKGGPLWNPVLAIPGPNRATNVPITLEIGTHRHRIMVDQRSGKAKQGWHSLDQFDLAEDDTVVVVFSNADTDDHVIVDAVEVTPVSTE